MKSEISEKQKIILLNGLHTIYLISQEKTLPHAAQKLLRSTFCSMQDVLREIGVSKPIPDDGFQKRKEMDHQWPIDNGQKWEALK